MAPECDEKNGSQHVKECNMPYENLTNCALIMCPRMPTFCQTRAPVWLDSPNPLA